MNYCYLLKSLKYDSKNRIQSVTLMESQDNHETINLLSDIYFGIGIASCCFTLLLILVNYRQMAGNTYARLIFVIQLLILLSFLIGWPGNVNFNNIVECKVSGALFYYFFLASNLFTEILMLQIYMDLANRRKQMKKNLLKIGLGVLALSLVVAFAPIELYDICYVGDFPLYCGYCFAFEEFNYGLLIYIIPAVVSVVLYVLLFRTYRKLLKKELNRTQKQALTSIFIPFLSVLLTIINLLAQVLRFTDFGNPSEDEFIELLMVLLSQSIYIVPCINLLFFLSFANKLEEIAEIKVERCRWVFCLSKLTEMQREDLISSID